MGSRTTIALAATGTLLVLAAGCGGSDEADARRDAEIARLADAVEELTAANERLGEAVLRQNRQLASLARDLSARAAAPGRVAAGEGGVEGIDGGFGSEELPAAAGTAAAGADAAAAADEGAVETILATEAGKKALQQAAAAEVARRETEERRTFVSFTIGRFARDVGLDERETDELQAIWKDSLDRGVELRRDFAALRALPEAERPAAREKVMETMRAIGRDRNERVAALLTTEELTKYEPVEDEIVEAMHGGPRRSAPARGSGGRE